MGKGSHETLGNNVIPINYKLLFEPDLGNFTTKGKEKISVSISRKTKTIMLNSKDIEISTARVVSGRARQEARISHDKSKDQTSLILEDYVSGDATLEIDFVCINNDGMHGFYRSRYLKDGKKRYMLSTQFEPADARVAFPCFDEPEFKATFEVSLIIDSKLDAISNMPIESIVSKNGKKKTVTFGKTPRMAPYLLYLGVGEYDYLEGDEGGIKIRVITTPGKKDLAGIGMEYAKESVSALQRYFGIRYMLPKVDYIGVPDFAAGAMENWGAITFREVELLGTKESSLQKKQRKAEVVAHETVHQWFGDLVTMKWWNDIWLNESFAEFMSYKTMDALHPEWKVMTQYVIDSVGGALVADGLVNTHPISVKVRTPGDADSVFDEISYNKGGGVLHMLENYVGEGAFRKGLHIYLSKNAYSNASKEDLWLALQAASKKKGKAMPVSGVMHAWVTKAGYPIVRVRKTPEGFSLDQERYTISKRMKGVWPIPITYLTASGASKTLMNKKRQAIRTSSKWIKLNYGQYGVYRVQYDNESLASLGALIKQGKLAGLDAWGVENDLFTFVRSGDLPVSDYLKFIEAYCMDRGYPINESISRHLNWLSDEAHGKRFVGKIDRVTLLFHKKLIAKLGWKTRRGDDATIVGLRSGAISTLGYMGDKRALSWANKMFREMLVRKKKIDVNLRGTVYSLAAWSGDKKVFDQLSRSYIAERDPDEKIRLLGALGDFRSKTLASKALTFANSDKVRMQDSYIISSIIASNPETRSIVWRWNKAHWKYLMKRYSSGTHFLKRFVTQLSFVSDNRTRGEIARFFADRRNVRDEIRLGIKQTLERIDANIRFMEKNANA